MYVSSMIPSARPAVPPLVIIFPGDICFVLRYFEIDGQTDGNMYKNNYLYRPGLWNGRVDQDFPFFYCRFSFAIQP